MCYDSIKNQSRLQHGEGVFMDRETEPFLDQACRDVMGQGVGAPRVGGLYIKLLEHLHGEDEVGAGQDLRGDGGFGGLCGFEIERVKQYVGINEGHGGRADRRG